MKSLILCALAAVCGPAAAAEPPARLQSFANSVLCRRAGTADWAKAAEGMPLFRQDTIYTMADSRAEVRFLTGETLSLTPNTLVVLRPPGGAGAAMLAGELRAARSRVVTRGAVIFPKTADAEFSAKVRPDRTTVVRVTRGVAEVRAQGKRVEVRTGYVTEVLPDRAPSVPVKAPPAPGDAPEVPAAAPRPPENAPPASPGGAEPPPAPAGAPVPTAFLPPNALDSVQAVKGYRLQVARDGGFREPVLDRVFERLDPDWLRDLLPPGDYFMRVAKIDLLGNEGKFSPPRPLKIAARE